MDLSSSKFPADDPLENMLLAFQQASQLSSGPTSDAFKEVFMNYIAKGALPIHYLPKATREKINDTNVKQLDVKILDPTQNPEKATKLLYKHAVVIFENMDMEKDKDGESKKLVKIDNRLVSSLEHITEIRIIDKKKEV